MFKSREVHDQLRKEAGEMPALGENRPFRVVQFMRIHRVTIQASAVAAGLLFLLVAQVGPTAFFSDANSLEWSAESREEAPYGPSAITQYLFAPGSYSFGTFGWTSSGPHSYAQNHGNEFSMGQEEYSPFLCIEQTDQNLAGYFFSGAATYSGPPLNSVTSRLDVRTEWNQNSGDDGNCYYEVDFQIQKLVGGSWTSKADVNNLWTYTGKETNPGEFTRVWGSGVVDGPGSYRLRVSMRVDPPEAGCLDEFSLYIEDFALYGEDNIPPSWVVPPSDQTVEYGNIFAYDLDATDSAGIGSWSVSPSNLFSVDPSGFIRSRGILSIGQYSVQVWVYDTQNNYRTGTFRVTVSDTTAPTWDHQPVSQWVEFGLPFAYDVDASDLSGISSYWVSLTGDFSIDGAGTIRNRTRLNVPGYYLEVRAYDPYGHFCRAFFSVNVQDTTDPTWDQLPTDQVVRYDLGLNCKVNASDLSGIDYYWVNDTSRFEVDGNGVITNKTVIPVGVYSLEVRAYDPYGNSVSATFNVTVLAVDPVWVLAPLNQTTEFGVPFRYSLNASDVFGITQWWVNDTTFFWISSNGLLGNLSLLPVGVHWLEVRAYNFLDRYCSAVFNVNCSDTIAPIWIGHLLDQQLEYGSVMSYDLDACDLSPLGLWWVNDTSNFQIDSNGLVSNLGNPPVGLYGIQVWVSDIYGNVLTGSFSVDVEDTTPPTWVEAPADQTIFIDEALDYELSAADLSGIAGWSINDTVHFSITADGRITSVGLLDLGQYGILVTVSDPHGNSLDGTFNVLVQPHDTTTPPPPPPENMVILVASVSLGAVAVIVIVVFYLRRQGSS